MMSRFLNVNVRVRSELTLFLVLSFVCAFLQFPRSYYCHMYLIAVNDTALNDVLVVNSY